MSSVVAIFVLVFAFYVFAEGLILGRYFEVAFGALVFLGLGAFSLIFAWLRHRKGDGGKD